MSNLDQMGTMGWLEGSRRARSKPHGAMPRSSCHGWTPLGLVARLWHIYKVEQQPSSMARHLEHLTQALIDQLVLLISSASLPTLSPWTAKLRNTMIFKAAPQAAGNVQGTITHRLMLATPTTCHPEATTTATLPLYKPNLELPPPLPTATTLCTAWPARSPSQPLPCSRWPHQPRRLTPRSSQRRNTATSTTSED
jgi:hypothetical protein